MLGNHLYKFKIISDKVMFRVYRGVIKQFAFNLLTVHEISIGWNINIISDYIIMQLFHLRLDLISERWTRSCHS